MYWTLAKAVQLSSAPPPRPPAARRCCGKNVVRTPSSWAAPLRSLSQRRGPGIADSRQRGRRALSPVWLGGPGTPSADRAFWAARQVLGHSPQNQGTQWWGEQEWDPAHSHAVTALGTQPLSTREESLSPSRRGDALCRGPPGEQSDSCRRRTARPHTTLVCQCYDARLIQIW